jgi:hypothetical protein
VGRLGYLEEGKSFLEDHLLILFFPLLYMVVVFIGKEINDDIRGILRKSLGEVENNLLYLKLRSK